MSNDVQNSDFSNGISNWDIVYSPFITVSTSNNNHGFPKSYASITGYLYSSSLHPSISQSINTKPGDNILSFNYAYPIPQTIDAKLQVLLDDTIVIAEISLPSSGIANATKYQTTCKITSSETRLLSFVLCLQDTTPFEFDISNIFFGF